MLWKAFFPPFSAVGLPTQLLKAGLVFSYFDPSNCCVDLVDCCIKLGDLKQ